MMPLRVVEGKNPPLHPRTKMPVPRGPRWYREEPYFLRRVRDGSMEAVDVSKLSPEELAEMDGGLIDRSAQLATMDAQPSADTSVKSGRSKAKK